MDRSREQSGSDRVRVAGAGTPDLRRADREPEASPPAETRTMGFRELRGSRVPLQAFACARSSEDLHAEGPCA
jgi:hypothetical protein